MDSPRLITRREACARALIFSAALALPRLMQGAPKTTAAGDVLHLFCFGDWGVHASPNQMAVAAALQKYAKDLHLTPAALMLLGDNFYGPNPGTDSPRWKVEFEDMYPASAFPGPCYAVLGNHDYDDQPGGEKIQMDYAKTPGTRWKMPALWYRLDLPHATFLCVDTHYNKMTPKEIADQQAWIEMQLTLPRKVPWMIVCGHHPVMSCGPHHGDSKHLAGWSELFYKNGVDAYLAGHEHDLQYLHEENTPTHWLVSGGGGQSLHPVKPDVKTGYANACFGFLHLALSATKMEATFVGSDAQVLYNFSQNARAISRGR
ncbi:MAG: metallophosphoesterase [Chthoniobacterales bacterium]